MGLLELAIIAFVISLIAGAFGYTDISEGAGTIAKWLFIGFLVLAVLFVILLVLGISIIA